MKCRSCAPTSSTGWHIKRTYETSTGIERDRQLLGALILCDTIHPLPLWLYRALRDQLIDRIKWQPDNHWKRYWMVTGRLEEARLEAQHKNKKKPSLRQAARDVSEELDRPFLTIWNSYKKIKATIDKMNVGPK
jgi:hypothetical protein